MTTPLVFLHIEKTAGTSLRMSAIEPNVRCRQVGDLSKELLRHSSEECLYGHIPYGYHWLTQQRASYGTMLREPVDRAISYYYFLRELDGYDLRDYAQSVSIATFFANPRFSNMQTRRLAGIFYDRAYPFLYRNSTFRRQMLESAMRHLAVMPVFGLQEQFPESARRFATYFGGGVEPLHERYQAARLRPQSGDTPHVSSSVLNLVALSNELDRELYSFACSVFCRPILA